MLAWREKHEPDVYKAAMDGLIEIIAEGTVNQMLAEEAVASEAIPRDLREAASVRCAR